MNKKVAILLGSESDRSYVDPSIAYFKYFGIQADVIIMSAHRNPKKVGEFASNAHKSEYKILIGGAGMAAHLAGALKAHSILPVIGLPLPGGINDGLDALFSTVQMPKGVPVATMAVGKAGAINAAVLCAEIFALYDTKLSKKLIQFKNNGCKI